MLLNCLLLASSLALAQFLFVSNGIVSRYQGYVYELHPNTHLLLVKNSYNCYFIAANDKVEKQYKDPATRKDLQSEIQGFIKSKLHIKRTSLVQAILRYRDSDANSGCVGRSLYDLTYPSGVTTTTHVTMTTDVTTTTDVAMTTGDVTRTPSHHGHETTMMPIDMSTK